MRGPAPGIYSRDRKPGGEVLNLIQRKLFSCAAGVRVVSSVNLELHRTSASRDYVCLDAYVVSVVYPGGDQSAETFQPKPSSARCVAHRTRWH